jgi:hypothetical protein
MVGSKVVTAGDKKKDSGTVIDLKVTLFPD